MIQDLGPRKYKTQHMTIELEEPDLVVLSSVGTIDKQDMLDMTEGLNARIKSWRHALLLIDQRNQEGMTPEARKAVPDLVNPVPYRGTVMFGGSFAMRTLGQMLMKLHNLTNGADNPTVFLKDEAEARAWIDKRRRELAAAGA